MEEENNWEVSSQNKKGNKKRFLRQLIVFIVSLLIIVIVAATIYLIYSYKSRQTNQDVNIPENKIEVENNVEEEEPKKREEISLEDIVYSIEDKDFYFDSEDEMGIKLFEYDNTNSKYAEIYFRLDSYSTDPSYSYVLGVKTEDGQNLLLNDRGNSISEREIVGGVTSSIKIDKEKATNTIKITVKEMLERSSRSRTKEREASVTLNLNTDLEKQEKIDISGNMASYELQGIKFETYKDDDVNKETYTMASPNCKNTAYSISISTQYGNRILTEENIQFYALNNINNLSLDDAFNIEMQINKKIGQYGLLDQYKVYTYNQNGEVKNEFEITFEDMKDLIDGKDVNSGGKRISAKDISSGEDNMELASNSKVTIGNNITAMKYNYKQSPERTNYMFILNGYIYYIVVPSGERYEENVDLFLDSLTK